MPTATSKRSDPAERLAAYPVTHFIDCPARDDAALAAEKVEHYVERRITVNKRQNDVQNDQRPSVRVMVAHCCLCGGVSYHDMEKTNA